MSVCGDRICMRHYTWCDNVALDTSGHTDNEMESNSWQMSNLHRANLSCKYILPDRECVNVIFFFQNVRDFSLRLSPRS